jgi:uncharacterized membrane protein
MIKYPRQKRYQSLDLTRGYAIGLMLIYHLCFGLSQMGIINAQFSTDYFWIGFRTLIIFLFLNLVGIGLYLIKESSAFYSRFLKRLLVLAIYAGLISFISYQVRPSYHVYFGILHHIFIASLLGLAFVSVYRLNLLLGLGLIILGVSVNHDFFNNSALHLLGIGNKLVVSDDFAPILPWFGFVLLGIFTAQAVFKHNHLSHFKHEYLEKWQPNSNFTKLICWSGRKSIHIYFLHFVSFYLLVYLFA